MIRIAQKIGEIGSRLLQSAYASMKWYIIWGQTEKLKMYILNPRKAIKYH